MKKEYKKGITIEYQYQDSPESDVVLEETFDSIFTGMIQGQKRLKEYFNSDEFKKLYVHLCQRKSLLVDFLQPIDKVK